MLDKLRELAQKYDLRSEELTDPAVYGNPDKLRALNQELRELEPLAEAYHQYEEASAARESARSLLGDPEMGELAKEEFAEAQRRLEELEDRMRILLLPRDPNDRRNVVMEIRAGVGGEEGALFAAALLRMYTMYAQSKGWGLDIVSLSGTELGGVKECSLLVEGADVFSRLKFESGVHRVQRVPETESGGRIHTSAATVAVLPEAEEVDVELNPADIEMQVFRSSGAGGQHVNKTSSAVRLIQIGRAHV